MCRLPNSCLIVCVLIGLLALWPGAAAWPQQQPPPKNEEERAQRKGQLEKQLNQILEELEELQREMRPAEGGRTPEGTSIIRGRVEPEEPGVAPEMELADVSVISGKELKRPEGLAISATERSEMTEQPTRHMRESLESLPGMVVRQANGPRDFNISIRGQGAKNTFGVRNLKMYEDMIPQTQSDGLARLDQLDPWFYNGVEVLRGAASSMYDNYALGGAVHWRTRRGADIDGVEMLNAGGSWGFYKGGMAVGKNYGNWDVAMFGSYQREDGYINHSNSWTATENLNFRFHVDNRQTLYFKFMNNDLWTLVPVRLTLNQFQTNPRQSGGLGSVTATSLDQLRRDQRTIAGVLYEREISSNMLWDVVADYDVKNIHQVFTQITDNVNPNFQAYSDFRHTGYLLGGAVRSYAGVFWNNMTQKGNSFVNLNNGFGTRGTLAQNNNGVVQNMGIRVGEEWTFAPHWTAAARFNYEHSYLSVAATQYNTSGATIGQVSSRPSINRVFDNYAPEFSITFRPTEAQRYWARFSTGYAIPTFSNLLTNPLTGLAGSNFDLKPMKEQNYEVGAEGKLHERVSYQVVGFWIVFENEIITQNMLTPTGGLGSRSVNTPESQYWGIESSFSWLLPVDGWRWTAAYTHMGSRYVKFVDQLNQGGAINLINQAGHQVPGVEKNVLNSKLSYEHPSGMGGWFEGSYVGNFYVDNNNLLQTPSYFVFNLNVHDTYRFQNSYVKFAKSYFEIDNIFNRSYVASAVPVADTVAPSQMQAFFAGYARSFYAGVTLGF